MEELDLVVLANYDGTVDIAEPVDKEVWGVDYITICAGETVDIAKGLARAHFPEYKIFFHNVA